MEVLVRDHNHLLSLLNSGQRIFKWANHTGEFELSVAPGDWVTLYNITLEDKLFYITTAHQFMEAELWK